MSSYVCGFLTEGRVFSSLESAEKQRRQAAATEKEEPFFEKKEKKKKRGRSARLSCRRLFFPLQPMFKGSPQTGSPLQAWRAF